MAHPAARVGDMHTCPLVDPGPKPHVGGAVTMGETTVLIGGALAARTTDQALCAGPPDFIVVGSSTVHIGGQLAAYLGSQTMHGGVISAGYPQVLIGGPPAGATLGNPVRGAALYPGDQSSGTCALLTSAQIIGQVTGTTPSEAEMQAVGQAAGVYTPPVPSPANEGTDANGEVALLAAYGIGAHEEEQTMENIQQAVAEGRGVAADCDAGILWGDPTYNGGGHTVNVTGMEYGSDGNLENVVINDTGRAGEPASERIGRRVPADQFERSLLSDAPAVVTDNPIY